MRFALASLAVLALAMPALGATELFVDNFTYAADQQLVDGQTDNNPGDGLGGWYSKDTKPNTDPYMTTGSSVEHGYVGSGGNVQAIHAFTGEDWGQLYIDVDLNMSKPKQGSYATWGRGLGAGAANNTPDWEGALRLYNGIGDMGAGTHKWGLDDSGTKTWASASVMDGSAETLLWEIDMDTGTQNLYLGSTRADIGSLGTPDVSTGFSLSQGGFVNGYGFVEYADDPGVEIFSTGVSHVPEPATMAVLALGGLGVLIRKRR